MRDITITDREPKVDTRVMSVHRQRRQPVYWRWISQFSEAYFCPFCSMHSQWKDTMENHISDAHPIGRDGDAE